MKGIVFVEFLEMVESAFSPDMVDEIIEESSLDSGGAYTAVGTYDHGEMVALVTALSKHSGIPAPELIRTFGEYLFGRFHALYPHFFEGIHSCMDFLARIEDVIHVEVLKLYPSAQLPKFDITRPTPDHLIMVYRSDRHLGDLAEGLIRECIRFYGEEILLVRKDFDEPGRPVQFALSRQ